jgi:hypothetical protein
MGFQKIFYFSPRLVAKFVDDWPIHLLHKIGIFKKMTLLHHVHDNLCVNSGLRVEMLISAVLIISIHIRAQVANN